MAEWLRRWTRNPLGSPRAGSNPANYVKDNFLVFQSQRTNFYTRAITIDENEYVPVYLQYTENSYN